MAEGNVSDVWDILRASAERAPWGWGLFISFVGTVIAVWPKLKRIGVLKQKQDGDLEGQRWDRLMALNTSLTERVAALELSSAEQVKSAADQMKQAARDMSEERKRCDEELSEVRKSSSEEIAGLRREIAGLYRIIGSHATASVRLMEPRSDLPEEMKDMLRSLEQGNHDD